MKMNFEVEVSFNIDDFVGRILCNFDDYFYDFGYKNDYVLLSREQQNKLKIAILERTIEILKEEED